MNPFTLKDYRASHFLLNFVRSQVQGWYTRENILQKAGHPDGKESSVAALARLLDQVNAWQRELKPEAPPCIRENGTVIQPGVAAEVARVLRLLFGQYAGLNERLNIILDAPEPLHSRKEDFQYIVAFMAWAYYAINHAVHGDIRFAGIFSDSELLKSREGDEELSQKELDFVNYLFNAFKDETIYNPGTCKDLAAMAEVVLNETMKGFAQQADRYLSALEKQDKAGTPDTI